MSRRRRRFASALLVAALAAAAAPAPAQEPTVRELLAPRGDAPADGVGPPEPPPPERENVDELGRDTPRDTLAGLLDASRAQDWARAAEYLDLRRVPRAQRDTRGPELAREFDAFVSRHLWLDPEDASDLPEGREGDGLPKDRERIGRIGQGDEAIELQLVRTNRGDGVRVWLVAPDTLEAVSERYDDLRARRLAEQYLPRFLDRAVLGAALWQWAALALLALAALGVARAFGAGLTRVGCWLVARSANDWDDHLVRAMRGPAELAVIVGLFKAGRTQLDLSVAVSAVAGTAERALFVVALTWLALRSVDWLAARYGERLARRGEGQVRALVQAGRRGARALLLLVALLTVLDNAGLDVTALIAGLGVGGIAVALAAQKTIENLFGGLSLVLDRPVKIGELCRFGTRLGVVEHIGLRSTRLRTPDRTRITVPNAAFAGLELENFGPRDKIWFHHTLPVRYDTSHDALEAALRDILARIAAHPLVEKGSARARFVGFGPWSMNVELSAYVVTRDFDEHMAASQQLLLGAMQELERHGSGVAFGAPVFK